MIHSQYISYPELWRTIRLCSIVHLLSSKKSVKDRTKLHGSKMASLVSNDRQTMAWIGVPAFCHYDLALLVRFRRVMERTINGVQKVAKWISSKVHFLGVTYSSPVEVFIFSPFMTVD